MKKLGKMAVVSTLALTIATTWFAAPLAMSLSSGSAYEKAAEEYAQNIENMTEDTGDAYEKLTEAYPKTAINNPNAPSEYLQGSHSAWQRLPFKAFQLDKRLP